MCDGVLTDAERKAIIYIKLFQKSNRYGPTWGSIRHQIGLSYREMQPFMYRLKKRGYVVWQHKVKHSTFATKKGVRCALASE